MLLIKILIHTNYARQVPDKYPVPCGISGRFYKTYCSGKNMIQWYNGMIILTEHDKLVILVC